MKMQLHLHIEGGAGGTRNKLTWITRGQIAAYGGGGGGRGSGESHRERRGR